MEGHPAPRRAANRMAGGRETGPARGPAPTSRAIASLFSAIAAPASAGARRYRPAATGRMASRAGAGLRLLDQARHRPGPRELVAGAQFEQDRAVSGEGGVPGGVEVGRVVHAQAARAERLGV